MRGSSSLRCSRSANQQRLRADLVPVKVRGRADDVHPGGFRKRNLPKRRLDPAAAVIAAREDMRVKIDLCHTAVLRQCSVPELEYPYVYPYLYPYL